MGRAGQRRALLVDALGTLVMLEDPVPALVVELRERFGVTVTPSEARAAIRAEIGFYRAHLQDARDPDTLAALRGRCAEVLRAALPDRDGLRTRHRAEMTEALLAALRFRAFPDAAPALAALRERGTRIVVVSNWDVSLEEVLGRVGLRELLDGVVTSAAIGARKPEAAPFRRGLALAGASAGAAVHVGDSVAEDIAGARAAGIEPLLLLRDPAVPPPPGVTVIRGLGELAAAI